MTQPWIQPDLKAATAALGLSPAQVLRLRKAGAPLPATGPVDELAVRLWNRDAAKPLDLLPAAGDLEPYGDFLRPRPAPAPEPKEADQLKARRAEHEALKIAARKGTLVAKGQQAAADVLNAAERDLLQSLASLAGTCWSYANSRTRAQAEPDLIRTLRTHIKAAIARAVEGVK
jgi:hypothetical protein